MSSCEKKLVPPMAKKESFEMINHGHKRVDNYYWMRLTDEQKKSKTPDIQTVEVINYIDQENNYTQKSLSHTSGLQENLFDEIIERIPKDDATVPYLDNGYFYYSRYEDEKRIRYLLQKKRDIRC